MGATLISFDGAPVAKILDLSIIPIPRQKVMAGAVDIVCRIDHGHRPWIECVILKIIDVFGPYRAGSWE